MAYGMGQGQQPIIVLREGTERSKDKEAQYNNIAAARAVADAVKSTLGPKGMDKMLVDSMGDVVITNDGVTILKEIDVQHPAAKMVVEIAKTQDTECGDGTTSSVIIAGELLKKAEALIEQNIHPTIIANGYKMAAAEAIRILDTIAVPITSDDTEKLKRVAEAIDALAEESMPEELRFIRELLRQDSLEAARAMIDAQAAQYGGALLPIMDSLLEQLKDQGQDALTEYVQTLRAYTAETVG